MFLIGNCCKNVFRLVDFCLETGSAIHKITSTTDSIIVWFQFERNNQFVFMLGLGYY